MNTILFFVVIFFSFMLQGITGFAGSILAMPPSIELITYEVAKPIINIVGLLGGLYIVIVDFKYIDFKQVRKMIGFLLGGVVIGGAIYRYKLISMDILYFAFICFVGYVGIRGLIFSKKEIKPYNKYLTIVILLFAGIVATIFNTGGPVMVGYASSVITDKKVFRATLSFMWVCTNITVVINDVVNGLLTSKTLIMSGISIPILCTAMFIGNIIYKHISPEHFKKLTYILLIGIAIFVIVF